QIFIGDFSQINYFAHSFMPSIAHLGDLHDLGIHFGLKVLGPIFLGAAKLRDNLLRFGERCKLASISPEIPLGVSAVRYVAESDFVFHLFSPVSWLLTRQEYNSMEF